jgi:Na+-transporting methylmalonyl-CoA/oxaloacetate decarboxylase gamma subunit
MDIMKKYTNKILVATLILLALVMIIVGSVEIRKAYHNGDIKTKKEIIETHKNAEKIIVYTDSVVVVDKETENETEQ